MADMDTNLATQWKALNPQQRDQALSRMNPDQKTKLASSLGYKAPIAAQPAPQSPTGDWRDALTRIEPHKMPHNAKEVGQEIAKGVGNIGAGGLGMVLRPESTIEGMASAVTPKNALEAAAGPALPAYRMVRDLATQLRHNPLETIESGIGQTAVGEAGGAAMEAGGRVAQGGANAAARMGRKITGTGPEATGKFVADVAERNRKAIKDAEVAYQDKLKATNGDIKKAEEARQKELKSHSEAMSERNTKHAAEAEKLRHDKEQQAKIEPAKAKLKTAVRDIEASIETAREKALKVGNEKYSGVNEKLNNFPADMEKITDAYGEAAHSLGEAGNPPPILTRLGKTIEKGEPLSYKDEQLLYSELGKELSKGTLPGSTFHAYDLLHDELGNDMQRIADANGQGVELSDARDYWRRMKQTFGKPLNIGDNATKTLRAAAPSETSAEEQEKNIRLLGSFDPKIPAQFEDLSKIRQGAESLPEPIPARVGQRKVAESRTPPPKLAPREPEIPLPEKTPAQLEVVTPETLSQQKSDAAFRASEPTNTGRIPRSPVGIAHFIQRHAVSLLADHRWGQNFINSLTSLTPDDINQAMRLPADQRSGFESVVKEAKRRGIPVGTGAAVGAFAGSKTRQLQSMRKYQQTAVGPNGHVIGSNDGAAWFDSETGEPVANQ